MYILVMLILYDHSSSHGIDTSTPAIKYGEKQLLISIPLYSFSNKITVVPPYPWGGTFQDLPWMPETADRTKPYIYYFFSIHTYDKVKFIN